MTYVMTQLEHKHNYTYTHIYMYNGSMHIYSQREREIEIEIDREDLIKSLVLYIIFYLDRTWFALICAWFPRGSIAPQERRTAHAFSTFAHFSVKNVCLLHPNPLFKRTSLASPNSLETRSPHACAVQTRFRPCNFGVFFESFSLNALVCCASALLYCT